MIDPAASSHGKGARFVMNQQSILREGSSALYRDVCAVYDALYSGELGPFPSRSQVAKAHRAIWIGVVSGDLKGPGRLSEVDIAELVGVSRPPLREAIDRLTQEGLLVRYGRGISAASVCPADIENIHEFRMVIEGFAAGRAAAILSDAEIDQLELDQTAPLSSEKQESSAVVHVVRDFAFHDRILGVCQNQMLLAAMRGLRARLVFLRFFQSTWFEKTLFEGRREHLTILRALRARDAAAAQSAMVAHIRAACDRTLANVRAFVSPWTAPRPEG